MRCYHCHLGVREEEAEAKTHTYLKKRVCVYNEQGSLTEGIPSGISLSVGRH